MELNHDQGISLVGDVTATKDRLIVPNVFYSVREIKEFIPLLEKIEEDANDLNVSKTVLFNPNDTDNTSTAVKIFEEKGEAFSKETNSDLIARKRNILQCVKRQYIYIATGRFGICFTCKEKISNERLILLPLSIDCIECAEKSKKFY